MSRSYLRANVVIIIEGEHHVIERQCTDGVWVLRNKSTGRSIERTSSEIFDAYATGTVKFESSPLRSISSTSQVSIPRTLVNEETLRLAKMRMRYVRAHAGKPRSMNAIERTIEAVWATLALGPDSKPHWSTVYRWVRAFEESGELSSVLIDAVHEKGNRSSRYSQDVIDICQEVTKQEINLERLWSHYAVIVSWRVT